MYQHTWGGAEISDSLSPFCADFAYKICSLLVVDCLFYSMLFTFMLCRVGSDTSYIEFEN